MKIIRFSENGFVPQYQSHHLEHIKYILNNFRIEDYPEHLRPFVEENQKQKEKLYRENYSDFEYGVWVFIDGHKNNQSLNHLKHKVPCFKAELPDDTEVYDVNWSKKMKLSDSEVKGFGCYVPERSLKNLKIL